MKLSCWIAWERSIMFTAITGLIGAHDLISCSFRLTQHQALKCLQGRCENNSVEVCDAPTIQDSKYHGCHALASERSASSLLYSRPLTIYEPPKQEALPIRDPSVEKTERTVRVAYNGRRARALIKIHRRLPT